MATAKPVKKAAKKAAPKAAAEKTGSATLPAEFFGIEPNIPVMHQVVTAQLAHRRSGTQSTKTRSEVRGGGKKPFGQKGTGGARQGSIRAPHFSGGGIALGPKPRKYTQRTPKKMIAAALRGLLSDRARNSRIHVVTEILASDSPSTKGALAAVRQFSDRKQLLVVISREEVDAWRSLRNATDMHLIVPDQLNAYDVVKSDDVVFTHQAIKDFLAARAEKAEVSA